VEWIKCCEQLPVMDQPMCGNKASVLLLFTDGKDPYIGFVETVRGSEKIIWSTEDESIVNDVTHWMHYPGLPVI
jgi:hypothetical protein